MNKLQIKVGIVAIAAIILSACGKQAGIEKTAFGTAKGKAIDLYTFTNHQGAVMKVCTYGGTVTELWMPDKSGTNGNVVLGFNKLEDYLSDAYEKSNPNFGGLIGRYGNRIAKGKFTLDSVTYTLACNNGENHLHGGNIGFNRVVWEAVPKPGEKENSLELTYTAKDGEEGYPGNLKVTVVYTLTDNNELKIDYTATTDKATLCNLTNHSYFNLSAGAKPTILDHEVTILADKFTPVDSGLIPTGELLDVQGTPMDFTTPHTVGERIDADYEQLRFGGGYDHNWVLRNNNGELALAATVYEPVSGRFMEVLTTEPGVQFYTGNFLDGTLFAPDGKPYVKRGGLCLETQHFPDSPNEPTFPSTVLRPGQTYHTQTIYKFSTK